MTRIRSRLRWRGAAVLLIALLLVPVALSGHNHPQSASSHPCAACAITHHLPIVGVASAVLVVVALVCAASSDVPSLAPLRAQRAPHSGRAPPPLPAAFVA